MINFEIGEIVSTEYGDGRVQAIQPDRGVYSVGISFDAYNDDWEDEDLGGLCECGYGTWFNPAFVFKKTEIKTMHEGKLVIYQPDDSRIYRGKVIGMHSNGREIAGEFEDGFNGHSCDGRLTNSRGHYFVDGSAGFKIVDRLFELGDFVRVVKNHRNSNVDVGMTGKIVHMEYSGAQMGVEFDKPLRNGGPDCKGRCSDHSRGQYIYKPYESLELTVSIPEVQSNIKSIEDLSAYMCEIKTIADPMVARIEALKKALQG
jgi:hypothetical protein